jgi:hypothetical protein
MHVVLRGEPDDDVHTHAARPTEAEINSPGSTPPENPICQVKQDEKEFVVEVVIDSDEELEADGVDSSEPEAAVSSPQNADDVTKYTQEVKELETMLQKKGKLCCRRKARRSSGWLF